MPNLPGMLRQPSRPVCSPLGGDDLRVHQLDDVLVLVHHHAHTAQHAHLRGSQTHAAGIQQRLLHVVDQRVQALIELRHRAAHLGQALVTLQYDLSQSHISSVLSNPSELQSRVDRHIAMLRAAAAKAFISGRQQLPRSGFSFWPTTVISGSGSGCSASPPGAGAGPSTSGSIGPVRFLRQCLPQSSAQLGAGPAHRLLLRTGDGEGKVVGKGRVTPQTPQTNFIVIEAVVVLLAPPPGSRRCRGCRSGSPLGPRFCPGRPGPPPASAG